MTNRFGSESLEMPDDLTLLDAELSSIQYEERPSFAPELQAELAVEWERVKRQTPRGPRLRYFAAAASVVLMLATAGVPSARASLVRLIGSFQEPEVVAPTVAPVPSQPRFQAARFEPTSPLVPPEAAPSRRTVPLEPPAALPTAVAFGRAAPTLPEVADRTRTEALIRRHYPDELERLGVGGSVRLLLWVDESGAVDNVQMVRGSGIPGLDRAALGGIARELRFRPATSRGENVGTWVEFDIVFRADPPESGPSLAADDVQVVNAPDDLDLQPLDLALIPEWRGEIDFVAPIQREAGELLLGALPDAESRFGPIESILLGEPPAGVAPTQWRAGVSAALEEAMARAPDNPAPLLALARIRRKQGLKTEARVLFERGLQRAIRSNADVSPSLLAELHYERGTLIKEGWLSHRNLGKVQGSEFEVTACPQARSSGGAATGFASVDRLIAWNYLCPVEFGTVMAGSFQAIDDRAEGDRAVMMGSFSAAVEAYPEHVGANVEILLSLADEGRWVETLDGARRFVRASAGHPYGLLIGGIALQRLGRSEEAEGQFTLALRGLPEAEAEGLLDLALLLDRGLLSEYRHTSGVERRDWERRFWSPLDPILNTEVNERGVEHTARAAYAHLRFGDAHGDPAEVWIRYGRPTEVRVIGETPGLRTEFWDYGAGPDITFSRLGSSDAMDLTPEGRAYVDDLREVFPHRYGTSSRMVYTLPGQVSRFRSAESGTLEFEIQTTVPAVLATGPTDTLDLGVFFIGPDGEKEEVTSRRVRAQETPVAIRIPVTRPEGTVAVELFNRSTNQASALRWPVVAIEESDGVSLSDVLVVAAAAPSADDVFRSADWIMTLALDEPLEVDAVGAYFEIYPVLTRGLASYTLRVEVRDRDTGAVTVVPIRPAGEEGFQTSWERRPTADGPTHEYLTVALADVAAGRLTLRVLMSITDSETLLLAERDLERRERH